MIGTRVGTTSHFSGTAVGTEVDNKSLSLTSLALGFRGPSQVAGSGRVDCVLSVANVGRVNATQVVAYIQLDPALTYLLAAGSDWVCLHDTGRVTCTRNVLAPGVVSTIQLSVLAPERTGLAACSATVQAHNAGPAGPGVVTTAVDAETTLAVSLATERKTHITSGTVTYTVQLLNTGNHVARHLSVAVRLDSDLEYLQGFGDGWVLNRKGPVVLCTRDEPLALGQAPAIEIVARTPAKALTAVTSVDVVSINAPTVSDTETSPVIRVPFHEATGYVPATSEEWRAFTAHFGLPIGQPTHIMGPDGAWSWGASALPDPAATSQLWIARVRIRETKPELQSVLGITGESRARCLRLQLDAENRLGCQVGSHVAWGSAYLGPGEHVLGLLYDRTGCRVAAFSEREYVAGVWSPTIANGSKGLLDPEIECLSAYCWQGPVAERSVHEISNLLTALDWSVEF